MTRRALAARRRARRARPCRWSWPPARSRRPRPAAPRAPSEPVRRRSPPAPRPGSRCGAPAGRLIARRVEPEPAPGPAGGSPAPAPAAPLRVDPELTHEQLAGRAVRSEGVGLAPAAVERQHEQGPRPLPQRLLRDHRLQLRDDVGVPAAAQFRVDAPLADDQPQLVEAARGRHGDALRGDVAERGPAPQGERIAQQRRGGLRLVADPGPPCRPPRAARSGADRARRAAASTGSPARASRRPPDPAPSATRRRVPARCSAPTGGGRSCQISSTSRLTGTTSPSASSSSARMLR